MNRASLSAEERKLRSRLRQLLGQADGFLHGSLIEMTRCCGNPRCRCASDPLAKHRSLYLGQSRQGKNSMLYIPKDLEQAVRRWAGEFEQASKLLDALSVQGQRRITEAKDARRLARKENAAKKAKTKTKTRAQGSRPGKRKPPPTHSPPS